MIELPISELKKLPKFQNGSRNVGIYCSPDGKLYKYCRETRCESYHRKEFFNYIKSLPDIPGLLKPIDLLCDKTTGILPYIYGYSMLQVEGDNIDKLLSQKLINDDNYDKKELIKKLTSVLRNINEYFIFSDVRNANILINGNDLTYIDWDIGRKFDDPDLIPPLYGLKCANESLKETRLTDTIKGFICALSLYYGYPIENMMYGMNVRVLKDFLEEIKANYYLINYVDYLNECAKNGREYANLFFDDFVDYIDLPSKKEIKRLEKVLKY